mmetsp:Transcript_11374/g.24513  ORF Transcript_11374/g.24513 Transcript_11374/m.24513 type:complete len:697 (-) Transcript_11374:110-2200(-)
MAENAVMFRYSRDLRDDGGDEVVRTVKPAVQYAFVAPLLVSEEVEFVRCALRFGEPTREDTALPEELASVLQIEPNTRSAAAPRMLVRLPRLQQLAVIHLDESRVVLVSAFMQPGTVLLQREYQLLTRVSNESPSAASDDDGKEIDESLWSVARRAVICDENSCSFCILRSDRCQCAQLVQSRRATTLQSRDWTRSMQALAEALQMRPVASGKLKIFKGAHHASARAERVVDITQHVEMYPKTTPNVSSDLSCVLALQTWQAQLSNTQFTTTTTSPPPPAAAAESSPRNKSRVSQQQQHQQPPPLLQRFSGFEPLASLSNNNLGSALDFYNPFSLSNHVTPAAEPFGLLSQRSSGIKRDSSRLLATVDDDHQYVGGTSTDAAWLFLPPLHSIRASQTAGGNDGGGGGLLGKLEAKKSSLEKHSLQFLLHDTADPLPTGSAQDTTAAAAANVNAQAASEQQQQQQQQFGVVQNQLALVRSDLRRSALSKKQGRHAQGSASTRGQRNARKSVSALYAPGSSSSAITPRQMRRVGVAGAGASHRAEVEELDVNENVREDDDVDGEHDATRMFQCEQCTKSFRRRHHLHEHVAAVHERTRPFACEYCGRTFGLKSNMSKHVLTVHLEPNQKPFACSRCDRSFKTKGNLKAHFVKIHPDAFAAGESITRDDDHNSAPNNFNDGSSSQPAQNNNNSSDKEQQ